MPSQCSRCRWSTKDCMWPPGGMGYVTVTLVPDWIHGVMSLSAKEETFCRIEENYDFVHLIFFEYAFDLPKFVNGTWKVAGVLTHSASAFWNRRTCNGLDAIPTKAIISRNSSSPASQSCCTSSPPVDFHWGKKYFKNRMTNKKLFWRKINKNFPRNSLLPISSNVS